MNLSTTDHAHEILFRTALLACARCWHEHEVEGTVRLERIQDRMGRVIYEHVATGDVCISGRYWEELRKAKETTHEE